MDLGADALQILGIRSSTPGPNSGLLVSSLRWRVRVPVLDMEAVYLEIYIEIAICRCLPFTVIGFLWQSPYSGGVVNLQTTYPITYHIIPYTGLYGRPGP